MPGPSPSSSNDSTNIPELRSAVIRSSDTRAEDELYFVNTPMTGRKHSQNSSALFESDQWKPAQCLSSPDTESLERLVSTITTVFRPKSRHQQSGCVNDGEQWGDGRIEREEDIGRGLDKLITLQTCKRCLMMPQCFTFTFDTTTAWRISGS